MPNLNPLKILLIRNIFANVGDEAMLCCEIDELRHSFPTANLTILTDNPQRIGAVYNIETDLSETILTTPFTSESLRLIHYNLLENRKSLKNSISKPISKLSTQSLLPLNCQLFVWNSYRVKQQKRTIGLRSDLRQLLDRLAQADLVIGGGGLIPSIPGIFLPKVALYKSLSILGVPFIFHGQTVLPQTGAEEVYRMATKILLRDRNLSRQHACAFGVSEQKAIEKLDPAFYMPIVDLQNSLNLETLQFVSQPFIAINIREWKNINFDISFSELAISLNNFHQSYPSFRILFFAMQAYGADNDLISIDKLRHQLLPTIETHILAATIRPSVLASVLAKAFAVITSRYHGAVFSLANAVPTIGISVSAEYDIKLTGIFSMFDATAFLLSADTLNSTQLIHLLNSIVATRETLVCKFQHKKVALSSLPRLTCILNELFSQQQEKITDNL
jgi:polysaccharide pyruvyl transferase WcaK-like protein